jgi:hypothetical protein
MKCSDLGCAIAGDKSMKSGLWKDMRFSYYHILCNLYEIFDEMKGLYVLNR